MVTKDVVHLQQRRSVLVEAVDGVEVASAIDHLRQMKIRVVAQGEPDAHLVALDAVLLAVDDRQVRGVGQRVEEGAL